MARRDSHVDPFNAGEPVLPWEEPSQIISELEEAGVFSTPKDEPKGADDHTAPADESKDADDYAAPKEEPSSYEAPRRRGSWRRRGRAKTSRHLRPQHTQADSTEPERKASHKDDDDVSLTPADGVRGCAILLVIAVVICGTGLLTMPDLVGTFIDALQRDIRDSDTMDAVPADSTDGAFDPAKQVGEKAKIKEATVAYLDDLAANKKLTETMSARFALEIEQALGYTPEELGIDTGACLSWFFEQARFTITDVYVLNAFDDNPAEGLVYFTMTVRKSSALTNEFVMRARSYLNAQFPHDYHGSRFERPELSDENRSALAQIIEEVRAEATETETHDYLSLTYTLEDGFWRLKEDEAISTLAVMSV